MGHTTLAAHYIPEEIERKRERESYFCRWFGCPATAKMEREKAGEGRWWFVKNLEG